MEHEKKNGFIQHIVNGALANELRINSLEYEYEITIYG